MNDNIILDIENRVLSYIDTVEERDPIFFSDLYKDDMNINVIEPIIQKLKEDSVLSEYSSNIYYKPMNTPFGELGINKEKLITRLYLKNNDKIIGYATGPTVWNHFRLTTQIPNKRWIATNNANGNHENSDLRIKLIVPKTTVINDNYRILQILDVIEDKNKMYIQDLSCDNYNSFLQMVSKADKDIIEKLINISKLYDSAVEKDIDVILKYYYDSR